MYMPKYAEVLGNLYTVFHDNKKMQYEFFTNADQNSDQNY